MANLFDDLQKLDISTYRHQDLMIRKLAVTLTAILDGKQQPQWTWEDFEELPLSSN